MGVLVPNSFLYFYSNVLNPGLLLISYANRTNNILIKNAICSLFFFHQPPKLYPKYLFHTDKRRHTTTPKIIREKMPSFLEQKRYTCSISPLQCCTDKNEKQNKNKIKMAAARQNGRQVLFLLARYRL